MNKESKIIIALGIIVLSIIILLAVFAVKNKNNNETASPFDSFAKCLAEKKITMYGADWCPHCQNEKKEFGNSWKYVPYIECPKNPKLCLDKGVDGYPTWILPDNKKLIGEQGLKKLSLESGCAL